MVFSRSLLLFSIGAMLVAGLASACGDDDDDETSTATSSGDGSTTATSPAGTATGSETPGATGSATSVPTEEQIPFETPATTFSKESDIAPPLLADIRAARNEGFDRVVFEFEGDEVPGYEVAYVDGVTECGSGAPVELSGEAVVSVLIRPANAHDDAGNVTVPRDVPTEGTAAVREVRNFCDFEAVVGYGISLSGVRPYRVFELEGPPRLVVDFSQ